MLAKLKQFFDLRITAAEQENPQHALQVATAALLIEMMRMDDEIKDAEWGAIVMALSQKFSLSNTEAWELAEVAQEKVDDAIDYHQFTSLINENFPMEKRVKIVEIMWQVAAADQQIDKHEDYLVRKIADLLYVSHKDFIAAKHRVIGG